MKAIEQNSVAAVLGVFVQLVMWIAVILSVLVIILFGLGFAASVSGGEVSVPFGDALSGGVKPEQFIAALATALVVFPGIIYVCVQLRRILRTLAEGDPFVPENAPRLLKIAFAIAIMEVARYAVIILLMAFVSFEEHVRTFAAVIANAQSGVVGELTENPVVVEPTGAHANLDACASDPRETSRPTKELDVFEQWLPGKATDGVEELATRNDSLIPVTEEESVETRCPTEHFVDRPAAIKTES